ncbi:MAG: hypothetical protein M1835_004604 [Candelina submexicana]|nr:MAG: hypothetical protein M1835_004604 [Candelina submexicana]
MHFSVVAVAWASVALVLYKIVSSIVLSRHYAAEARRLGCKPAPTLHSKLPFGLSNILRLGAAGKEMDVPGEFVRMREEVGLQTHQFTILGSTAYSTSDPKNIQAVLATQFQDFNLGPLRSGATGNLLGSGIFTQDGAEWAHSRAMLRPQFARDQVSNLHLEEQHVQNMIKALATDQQGWTGEVDLQTLFFRLTIDSASEFLFGESTGTQLSALPGVVRDKSKDSSLNETQFAHAFDQSQRIIAKRLRLFNFYWLYNPKEYRVCCAQAHEFVDYFVRKALDRGQREKDSKKGEDGKEKYVFLNELASQTQDPLELRYQLLNILLAGRDTTASLLGWVFYLLVRDPVRFEKLRAIIIEEFGSYSSPYDLTFAKLKGCQYLQYVINETLRLYPVVPGNGRRAIKDTTLPRGGGPDGQSPILVKKHEQVGYSVHVMHRRKDLWGQDADEFKPERWEGRKTDWSYLPFNGGPRICLGQQFALTETSYVIVRLVQRFDKMENMDTDPVVRHDAKLTNCSGNGVKVRLHAASD